MEATSNLSDALLAAGMVAIFFCATIWSLYRVVTWARRRSKRAYVIGAALAPFIALGLVVDPEMRIVQEAKRLKKREEDNPGDPPASEDESIVRVATEIVAKKEEKVVREGARDERRAETSAGGLGLLRRKLKRSVAGVVGIVFSLALLGCAPSAGYEPRDGDIVFHTSRSAQSLAIQLATKSPYSHMGIVYLRDGKPFVFEAVQPVKLTPLGDWIERGERGQFVVKRLRDADERLTAETLRKMRAAGEQLAGKDYDPYFEWSDDRVYCSELVWKVFERGAGIELGELQTIAAFDLSHPAVQAKVRERYGDHVPLDEIVVSPAAIFDAAELETVYQR